MGKLVQQRVGLKHAQLLYNSCRRGLFLILLICVPQVTGKESRRPKQTEANIFSGAFFFAGHSQCYWLLPAAHPQIDAQEHLLTPPDGFAGPFYLVFLSNFLSRRTKNGPAKVFLGGKKRLPENIFDFQ